MKIIRHECPEFHEENLQILPGPGNGTLHIKGQKARSVTLNLSIQTAGYTLHKHK